MIIPSIDLMNGHAVQLIGGKEKALDAGEPTPLAEKFGLASETAVIDLDAALGQGSNEETIKKLIHLAPCRVGGGIRSLESAIRWLDAGASKIIIGTKAVPELLSQLPKQRVIAALDAVNGEVVVEGWQTATGTGILERMQELRDYVGGFLVTFVEREGRLGGTRLDQVAELVKAAGDARVTIAGGVTTTAEIAELDRLGADAQVGMALYTGKMDYAEALVAPLTSERPDGLWPTVVCDERGIALGLTWSSLESVKETVKQKRGIYQSRKRGLWIKGESSGAIQDLLRIDLDCDRDCLRFTVKQHGDGFCHIGTYTCFGEGQGLSKLTQTIEQRFQQAPAGSYTRRLFDEPGLLPSKILEEAKELVEAKTSGEIVWEAADLLYFVLTNLTRNGITLAQVERELDFRSLRLSRRGGDAKE